MTKLIIFTDLHMVPEGTTIIGLDHYQRLAAGIEHVNRYHADADRVIFTGDLAWQRALRKQEQAHQAEVAQLRGSIAALRTQLEDRQPAAQ